MKRILYFLFLVLAVFLGVVCQTIFFRNEQQPTVFRFLESRITKIQEFVLQNKFTTRDLVFFGDSVAASVISPQSFDNQSKWSRSYNFSLLIRELEVNINLLSWFNERLEQRPDLNNLNVVFELSFLQLAQSSPDDRLIHALSAYNKLGLPSVKKIDFLTQLMTRLTSTKNPYIRTKIAPIDFLMYVAKRKLLDWTFLHFEWTYFIRMVMIERWSNPKLLDPAWDLSSAGYFDFNYKKNHELLDQMSHYEKSPEAQIAFYNFFHTECVEPTASQMDEFELLLTQLKITKSRVHNLAVVIAPISPVLYNQQNCQSKIKIYLDKVLASGISVFNYSNSIPKDNFIDLVHVDEGGALKWTQLLLSDLNQSFAP